LGYSTLGFLIRNYKLVSGNPDYRKPFDDKKFREDFSKLYDDSLFEQCWADSAVEIARLVRHALAHNGGRLTNHLRGKKHGLTLIGEDIQILPHDTRALFDLLKTRATSLAQRTQAKL
jgi:hypothetical protein